ncbi:MAG: hypothetical protein K2P87_05150 [Lachnospiraceae bacterium]|nr:hypothetical protein [Lachnospiraceae bacterium]
MKKFPYFLLLMAGGLLFVPTLEGEAETPMNTECAAPTGVPQELPGMDAGEEHDYYIKVSTEGAGYESASIAYVPAEGTAPSEGEAGNTMDTECVSPTPMPQGLPGADACDAIDYYVKIYELTTNVTAAMQGLPNYGIIKADKGGFYEFMEIEFVPDGKAAAEICATPTP